MPYGYSNTQGSRQAASRGQIKPVSHLRRGASAAGTTYTPPALGQGQTPWGGGYAITPGGPNPWGGGVQPPNSGGAPLKPPATRTPGTPHQPAAQPHQQPNPYQGIPTTEEFLRGGKEPPFSQLTEEEQRRRMTSGNIASVGGMPPGYLGPPVEAPPGYAAGPGANPGGNIASVGGMPPGYIGPPVQRPPGYAAGPGANQGGNIISQGELPPPGGPRPPGFAAGPPGAYLGPPVQQPGGLPISQGGGGGGPFAGGAPAQLPGGPPPPGYLGPPVQAPPGSGGNPGQGQGDAQQISQMLASGQLSQEEHDRIQGQIENRGMPGYDARGVSVGGANAGGWPTEKPAGNVAPFDPLWFSGGGPSAGESGFGVSMPDSGGGGPVLPGQSGFRVSDHPQAPPQSPAPAPPQPQYSAPPSLPPAGYPGGTYEPEYQNEYREEVLNNSLNATDPFENLFGNLFGGQGSQYVGPPEEYERPPSYKGYVEPPPGFIGPPVSAGDTGQGGQGDQGGNGDFGFIGPRIPTGDVLNGQQTQQLINDAIGGNIATQQGGLRDAANRFAGRGVSAGSPAMEGVANRLNLNTILGNTQARTQIPIDVAQLNAQHSIEAMGENAKQRGLDIGAFTSLSNANTNALTPLLSALVSLA